MVAYKKTFWLRIFQRKWKNDYYRKVKFYKNPKNLFLREIGVKRFKNSINTIPKTIPS